MRLVLASKSAARRQMLEAAGVTFETAAARADEEQAKSGLEAAGFDPRSLAEMLAEMKAKSVPADPDMLVIGADQTLETGPGEMFSKPGSKEEARDQLFALSGNTHLLHSAAVIVEQGTRVWGHTESVALTMRPLGGAFVDAYLDREYEAIRHSVGGYRIEGLGAQLFDTIEGSHFAILGLPLLPLLGYLRERGLLAN